MAKSKFPIKIILIFSVVLTLFILGINILSYTLDAGGPIAGYSCKFIEDKVAVLNDSITFPVSGNCPYAEIDYSGRSMFLEENTGRMNVIQILKLDASCQNYLVDVLPYIENTAPNTFVLVRDQNKNVFACLGHVGI